MPFLMGTGSLSVLVACTTTKVLAQLPGRGERSSHVGILDSRLLQLFSEDVETMLGRQPVLGVLNGGRSDEHGAEHQERPRVSVPVSTRRSAPAESGFTQCGQVWEPYETVVWNRSPDLQHHIACASASDNETIGICRSDGIGHEHWGFCSTQPSALCNDFGGKLWFAFCSDLQRVPAPTPAPTPVPAPTPAPSPVPTPMPPEPTPMPPAGLPPDSVLLTTAEPTGAPPAEPSAPTSAPPNPGPPSTSTTEAPNLEPSAPTLAPPDLGSPSSSTISPTISVPVITIDAPVEAGASSIPVVSVEGLSVGDCMLIQGGGNSETVCIADFVGFLRTPRGSGSSIQLVSPTIYAYPAGSTLTLLDRTNVLSTTAGLDPTATSANSQESAMGTTTSHDDHASSRDDPHVCTLSGECYDIRVPSEYSLLRVPHGVEEPDMLKLSADLDTDGVRPCGLFIKTLTLSGSWLNDQIVRVRPYTRNAGGSNWAGTATRTNFSLQLGDSPWRSFAHQDSLGQFAVVGRVGVRFVWREQYGQRMEAQSLEFSVGEGGQSALLTVSQASHQALNLDMWGLGRLGHARIAGVLGTEGHPASIEEPVHECRAATPSASPDATRRQMPRAARTERASILRASWQ